MEMTIKSYGYEPGNCTRYDLLYGKAPQGYLLVWLHRGGSGGSAFRFDDGGYIAAGYLAEKMSLANGGDTDALLAFLRLQGHRSEVRGSFDEAGQHIRGNTVEFPQQEGP
jgi:hypothetical protein